MERASVCGLGMCGSFWPEEVPKGSGEWKIPHLPAEHHAAAGFAVDRPEGDGRAQGVRLFNIIPIIIDGLGNI